MPRSQMQEFNVQRCTRRCQKSDRPLEPGERFYSVVVAHGADLIRYDCSEKEWEGPPDGAIGWWRGRMPANLSQGRRPTPNEILLDTLAELCERPEDSSLAYLLGVLLVRRRILAIASEATASKKADEEADYLRMVHASDGREFWVPQVPPQGEQVSQLQNALEELIFQSE